MAITDLSTDFSNGVALINLLEILSGKSVGRYALKPNSRFLRIENVVIALKFIDQKLKLRLYGTSAEDIVDGNTKIILGMVWRLIQTFRLKMDGLGEGEEGMLDDTAEENTSGTGSLPASASVRVHNAFKSTLLSWCQRKLDVYPTVSVENFDASFANGIAFCALIHRIHPHLIDLHALNKDHAVQNLSLAFSLAEEHFGIPQLLDPRDLVDSKPDELSVMTYISEYFHVYMNIERSRKADIQRLSEEERQRQEKASESIDKVAVVVGEESPVADAESKDASMSPGQMTNNERMTMELEIAEGLDEVEELKQKLKYQQDECSALRIKFAKKRKKLADYRAREREWMEKVESLLRENEALRDEAAARKREEATTAEKTKKNEANGEVSQLGADREKDPARSPRAVVMTSATATTSGSQASAATTAAAGDGPIHRVYDLRMSAPVIPYDLFNFLTEEIYITKIFLQHLEHVDTKVGQDREADNQWREENKRARSDSVDGEAFAEDEWSECAVLLVQRQVRVWLARRTVSNLRLLKRFDGQEHLVVRLQAQLRGWVARKRFREQVYMLGQRTETARELLRSENIYVDSLRVIVEVFLTPLRKPGSALSPWQVKAVFSEVEVIMNYTAILLDRVEKKLAAWTHNQCLGEIFLKLTDFLKVYTEYVYNFPKALTTFNSCKQKGPFKSFLLECQTNPRCGEMDLLTYLNMPVQRIPYYVAIFQALLFYTPEHHPDYENTKLALEKVRNVVKFIDEKRKRAENIQAVLRVQDSVVGKSIEMENLVQPSRRFIREGPLTAIRGTNEKTEGYYFLFNDLIVMTKKQKGKGRKTYKFVGAVQITPRTVVRLCPETVYTAPNSFQVISLTKQYTFACESDKKRREWYNDCNEVHARTHVVGSVRGHQGVIVVVCSLSYTPARRRST